jgi:hypothetical protein
MQGRRRASIARALQTSLHVLQAEVVAVDWVKVFKASFMLLFVAYPGVALKIMRMFRCVDIEGTHWLAADMRLQCYTGRWFG